MSDNFLLLNFTELSLMQSSALCSPVFLASYYQNQFPTWATKRDEKVEYWPSFLKHPYHAHIKQKANNVSNHPSKQCST